jgi:hypothetical protein
LQPSLVSAHPSAQTACEDADFSFWLLLPH